MNSKAYEKLNYSLAILSATAGGKRQGCIINSLHQVTSSFPPKFTITVNKDNETYKAVTAAGSFSVTLLAADCPEEIVDQFGYRSGRVKDKFEGRTVETDGLGNPYLTEHMASRISCKVTETLEIGKFVLFVAEAVEAEVLSGGEVLTLQDFTNRGKTVPPTATVYRAMEGNGFRCSVCGYVHESETLPGDFICPICRATADKFVKQE
ncbi:MAG: flavin reductase [Oscillibacter sp.]